MKINRSAIKHNAKLIIFGSKPSPLIASLIFGLISMVLQWFTMKLNGTYYLMNELLPAVEKQMALSGGKIDFELLAPFYEQMNVSPVAYILIIAIGVMSFILSVGFTIFCFHTARMETSSYANILDGFEIFGKVLWLGILKAFFTFLWGLAGIIPGTLLILIGYMSGDGNLFIAVIYPALTIMAIPVIIAELRYRMSLYIMLDHPEMSARSCITASKNMMKGRKMELFVLDLSFLGWQMLTMVPLMSVWVVPYRTITEIYFYIALRDLPYVESSVNSEREKDNDNIDKL